MEVDDPADFPIRHFHIGSDKVADRRSYTDFHYNETAHDLIIPVPLKETSAISTLAGKSLHQMLPDDIPINFCRFWASTDPAGPRASCQE